MLNDYKRKRRFEKTPEPEGTKRAGGLDQPIFVVQKHDASHLHYDFRLEIDGVLASWAVPKGPSLNPKDKRLAVHVEDHPLAYATFEGTIPEDEYGGGTVMVWDFGTVRYKTGRTPAEQLRAGEIEFELKGAKLGGGWVLVHSRMGGQEKNWLLIKRKDAHARDDFDVLQQQPDSIKTGRTLKQIADEAERR